MILVRPGHGCQLPNMDCIVSGCGIEAVSFYFGWLYGIL
jgi:hypothetical protein